MTKECALLALCGVFGLDCGDIIQGEYINPYTWLYVQIACDAYVVMRLACCVMAYPL